MTIPNSKVAWGKVRDALAAVHNLETLLRSPRVGANVLAALLPELHGSCVALRVAFESPAPGARTELATFALERLDELEQAMKEARATDIETRARLALEQVVARVGVELDLAVELLDLIERADAASPTELSLEELARASLGIGAGIARGEEASVRIDADKMECMLVADAHVVSRLVASAVARVRSAGAQEITVRARCEPSQVRLSVASSDSASVGLPVVRTRVKTRISPTDAIVDAAARAIRGTIAVGDKLVVLTLPRG